ncbi:MAG TPA: 50S ribosomal protein L10 [Syntrophobacteraceae bacterium]|nr:50S ribosomal protein L10 [Syntrophobacteraceae bacterium]
MERAKKEQVVADLHQKLQRATATVLTDFKGLTVAEITDLRNALAAEQVDYCVIKNTLMRLASQDTSAAVLQPILAGTCAVAISYGDPSVPAKIIKKFSKANEKLKVKAGALGKSLLSVDEVATLADLPTKEELLGKLLGTFKAVPTGLVTVLSGVTRSFVGVLAAIQNQKEQA